MLAIFELVFAVPAPLAGHPRGSPPGVDILPVGYAANEHV